MKKTIISFVLALIACTWINAQEQLLADTLLQRAAQAYAEGKYDISAAYYEDVLASQGQSYQLYYNLGNAYYKAANYPKAILYYERAMLLNPRDPDLQFNLELCQAHVVDKIQPLGEILFVRWYKQIQRCCSSNAWAAISLAGFAIFVLCLALYFFTKRRLLKKLSFSLGIISVVITIFSLVNAGALYKAYQHPDKAIVFAPTVTVKSSPDQSGTDLFLLHEGTKVRIKSRLGAWVEIELADGNVGWMPESCIEII